MRTRLGGRERRLACLSVAWLLVCGAASAQSPDPGPPPAPGAGTADYRVGPGDMLGVAVFGVSDFDQATRVSNSGKVHLRRLGIVSAAHKTVREIEAELATRIRDRGFMHDPWVQVRVLEYRAHPVYLLGEVMTPGQYVLKRAMTLRDLIVLGQGFNEKASPVGYLYRLRPQAAGASQAPADPAAAQPAQAEEVMAIDFRALESNAEANLPLRPGDVLYCPERRKSYYFVVGDVLSPGLYELPYDSSGGHTNVTGPPGLRLSQALAKAGGPARTAKLSKALVVRYDATGARREIPIDLAAVLNGQQADLDVQFNDIIFVPGSTAKTIGYGLLGALPGIATARVNGAAQ